MRQTVEEQMMRRTRFKARRSGQKVFQARDMVRRLPRATARRRRFLKGRDEAHYRDSVRTLVSLARADALRDDPGVHALHAEMRRLLGEEDE
jgi:hypothetical protein